MDLYNNNEFRHDDDVAIIFFPLHTCIIFIFRIPAAFYWPGKISPAKVVHIVIYTYSCLLHVHVEVYIHTAVIMQLETWLYVI